MPLNTYSASALSFCTLTKKKNTLIALEAVFAVPQLFDRSEQVTEQELKLQQDGRQKKNHLCYHLFLHTFDDQIFTVLSLDAVKICLELVHMALMGLS